MMTGVELIAQERARQREIRLRQLVVAGALIAAEIDRLQMVKEQA